MKLHISLCLVFASLAFGQRTVSLSLIDSLTVPPLDSALAHAFQYSPLLYNEQSLAGRSETLFPKWGFAFSLVPSPSYSFNGLDRGWRLSLNVGSLITALKEYQSSRTGIRLKALALEKAKESLCFELISDYARFSECMASLESARSVLNSENRKAQIRRSWRLAGRLTDSELESAESGVARAENEVEACRLSAWMACMEVYRNSGYRFGSMTELCTGTP